MSHRPRRPTHASHEDHAAGRRHDLRGVPGQRAARATAAPGVKRAAVNLMTHEATVPTTRRRPIPREAGRRDQRDRLRLAPAVADVGRRPRTKRASRRRRASTPTLRLKSIVSLALGAVAMIVSMPLMGGGVHGARDARQRSADRAGRCASLDPPLRAALPWLYAIAPRPAACAAGGHRGRDGVGRPALLHRARGRAPPPHRRHEHADRDRHRRGVRLFAWSRPLRPACSCAERRATRRLLRSGHHHHRAGPARQRHGGAREAHDDARAAPAREAAAVHRARAARRTATWTCRSPRSRRRRRHRPAGRTHSRWTASSRQRQPAPWTNRCSPANRCRWTSSPAIA